MHGAGCRVEAGEAAADVHEAGVAHDEDFGARDMTL